MARTSRFRSRIVTLNPGGDLEAHLEGPLQTTHSASPARTFTSTCSDSWHTPIVDSPFTCSTYKGVYPELNGKVIPSDRTRNSHSVYKHYTPASLPTEMTGMTPLPAPNGWMLDLVAGTNPSRPVLNIPEAVENLIDLPKMLRNLGNLLLNPKARANPRGFAGEYLGIQFGWLPLIEDLTKLLNFQTYANKRNKELHQLYSGKGLRRRLKFADDTATYAKQYTQTTYANAVLTINASLTVKRTQWATIRWKPTTPPPYHPDDERWNQLSTRLVLGATPEAMANGLWKVIPWTWLIGWFTNVGKYTLANSWTVPATHGNGNFMSKAEATLSPGVVDIAAGTGNVVYSGVATRTLSTRAVGTSVSAGVNMPYLDMFRLSILGSLFIQRFFR